MPDLSLAATGATLRSRDGLGHEQTYDDFFLGLNSSWEIDLWERVQAAEEDTHATALSLSAQIADVWIDLLNRRQLEQQLKEQLAINQRLLELIEMRFIMSRASALDVSQQGQTVKAIEGGLITVRSQTQLILHQLAQLTGKAATDELVLNQRSYPKTGQIPTIGLPADLLAARPDIRAAGLRLQSST